MCELRETRTYMLGVGIVAALLRIGMTLADNFNLGGYLTCAENALYDLASLWSSYWS